jgi:hypothetical protein
MQLGVLGLEDAHGRFSWKRLCWSEEAVKINPSRGFTEDGR